MIDIDGEPWFVANDVCIALGLNINAAGKTNVTAALRKLKTHQIGLHRIQTNSRGGGTRMQEVKIISEAGLYKLVMRSDKDEAEDFQEWVAEIVLPAIRKDGGYVKDQELVATGEMTPSTILCQKKFPGDLDGAGVPSL